MDTSRTTAEGAQRLVPAAAPLEESARIVPLDVLRGVALLGILLMNIQAFSMIGAAYQNPTAYGDLHGANWWIWMAKFQDGPLEWLWRSLTYGKRQPFLRAV